MATLDRTAQARASWLDAVSDLSLSCSDSDAAETVDRLREMNALLLIAPEATLLEGARPISPARLEKLLEVGAYESAALAMLAQKTGFLLSRGGDGQSMATIAFASTLEEESGVGANVALALVCALARGLSSAREATRLVSPAYTFGAPVVVH